MRQKRGSNSKPLHAFYCATLLFRNRVQINFARDLRYGVPQQCLHRSFWSPTLSSIGAWLCLKRRIRRDGSRLLRPNTFEAAWYRQVLHCRLVPDRLRIKTPQIQKLGRKISPDPKAQTRVQLEGDWMGGCPSSLGQKSRKFL